MRFLFFFFQAEDGIRDAQESRGLGDVYKRQAWTTALAIVRERMEGAHKSVLESVSTGIWHDYRRGRYEMARDILREMEERGKP